MRLICIMLFLLSFVRLGASVKSEIEALHQTSRKLLHTNPDSAFALGKVAEIIAAKEELKLEEAYSIFFQAYILQEKEEYGNAFDLYLKALKILRNEEEKEAKRCYTKMLVNLGSILEQHYAYYRSLQYYEEGISVARNYSLTNLLIKLLYSKATVLRHSKRFDEALASIREGIDLARLENDEQWIISSLNERGLILKDMNRFDEARESYQLMIDFKYKAIDSRKYLGQAWHNMAVTYMEERLYEKAIHAYSKALNFKSAGAPEKLYISWMDLGEAYYLLGEYREAYKNFMEALKLYDQVSLQPKYYILFNFLSKVTYATQEYDKSHRFSQKFEKMNKQFLLAQEEMLKIKDQHKMDVLTAKYFQELKATETEKNYQMVLIISVMFFTSIIIFEKVRQYYIRHSLKQALLQIEQE